MFPYSEDDPVIEPEFSAGNNLYPDFDPITNGNMEPGEAVVNGGLESSYLRLLLLLHLKPHFLLKLNIDTLLELGNLLIGNSDQT